jgi:hypothetical protein
MFKKIFWIAVLSLLINACPLSSLCPFACPLANHAAFASSGISINEIMYDLDGGDIDWIEVVNSGDVDIDLSTYKLLVSNSTSNHGISPNSGSAVLSPGDYGVIVSSANIGNYTQKWGNGGNIFTSSFSLPNDAGKIELNDGDKTKPLTSVSYSSTQGGSGDGNSLQLINSSWVGATPTPDAANEVSSSGSVAAGGPIISSGNNGGSNGTASSITTGENVSSSSKTKTPTPQIKTKIIANTVSLVSLPILFQAMTTGLQGEEIYSGKYFWNFGDGTSKEQILNGMKSNEKISHSYMYPGEYVVTLEFFPNNYSDTPDATTKIFIKVVRDEILISSVGDKENEKDFFVELENKTDYDVDLGNWKLTSGEKKFFFPKNTILESKEKIIFSGVVTGLVLADRNNLKLENPENKIVYDLPLIEDNKNNLNRKNLSVASNSKPSQKLSQQINQNITANNAVADSEDPNNFLLSSSVFPSTPDTNNGNYLTASAGSRIEKKENSNNFYVFASIFAFFIVICASLTYFIRRKSYISQASDEFEILDE